MDSDSKHVLTILGLVACFGAGYFVCKGENKDALKLGEKLSVFTRIENKMDGKANLEFENENLAVENAVNAYYSTNDRFFNYSYDGSDSNDNEFESVEEKTYDYFDKYQLIDDIACINCSFFSFYSTQGFIHFFRDNPKIKGFIIDLRENIGGYTDDCTNMLGHFLDSRTVAQYQYYNGDTENIDVSGTARTEKVIILVNEHTASAAEIFTAAMKQFYQGDVTVLGTKTRGKGTFQLSQNLSEDEYFRYTAGYYTVGNWQCYDGVGITPDIELSMEYDPDIICTDEDIQLQAALDLFK